jgi:hypothetical protein
MHADHPARVAAGGAGLATEAGGEGDVAERQLVRGEDLARVQAGDRDLGRAGEIEAVVAVAKPFAARRSRANAYSASASRAVSPIQ